jgi:hypothetical protein
MANWDCGGSCHHDGIHCYTVNGGVANHYGSGIYIYNNRFDGTLGTDNTAWIFIEGGSGGGATPCATSTSKIWIFNNVARAVDRSANDGLFTVGSGSVYVFNNTLVGHDAHNGNLFDCCSAKNVGHSAFVNNLLSTSGQFLGLDPAFYSGSNVDFNVYANGNADGNGWYCEGFEGSLAAWRHCIGGDGRSRYVKRARLNNNGSPQNASAALGAGLNLSRLCVGALTSLCRDIHGALRPLRMGWDVGAYQLENAAVGRKAIGHARLAASRASIERFYGRKSALRTHGPLLGVSAGRRLVTATYRRHGGVLEVGYASGRVVAVATTSRYYTTPSGLGVGAETSGAKLALHGWRRCGRSFARVRSGVATVVRLSSVHVSAIAVAQRQFLNCRSHGSAGP